MQSDAVHFDKDVMNVSMKMENVIEPSSSCHSGNAEGNGCVHDSKCETHEAEFVTRNLEAEEKYPEILENSVDSSESNAGISDNGVNVVVGVSMSHFTVEMTEAFPEEIALDGVNDVVLYEKEHQVVQDGSCLNSPPKKSISGVKRQRLTVEEKQSSVHVMYNSLPRDSKLKLEELLKQWSEWHAQNCSSSCESIEGLETGEETYFPAMKVGLDKSSSVSFWVDNQTHNPQYGDSVQLDGKSVPLYDRGFSLALTPVDGPDQKEGGLDIVNAPRCFNCGSYNHSLKDCSKPRDNVAVNSARRQQKSKRNQIMSLRNSCRYYQNSPAGKFDGLRPGALDTETRKLLGLGELDPPPWLNRMREIGYPPGYLDLEDDNQPSGIIIFSDEENKMTKETEEGEILDSSLPKPSKKMSVDFPGINGPIPENANERRWRIPAAPSSFDPSRKTAASFDLSRNRPYDRPDHLSEHTSRGHHHEKRCFYDFRDDFPPGVEPQTYYERYGMYDSSYRRYDAYESSVTPRNYGRQMSDRSWRSPFSP